jgi:hypothetical protein
MLLFVVKPFTEFIRPELLFPEVPEFAAFLPNIEFAFELIPDIFFIRFLFYFKTCL